MADDLGDSHASSLQQGGALPATSTALRNVGKIFSENGKTITVNLYPTNNTKDITLNLYNNAGTLLQTVNGLGNLTLTYTPSSTGFYQIRVKNTSASNPSQKVFVKATYTSPKIPATSSYPARSSHPDMIEPDNGGWTTEAADEGLQVYPDPVSAQSVLTFSIAQKGNVDIRIYSAQGHEVSRLASQVLPAGQHRMSLKAAHLTAGVYVVKLVTANGTQTKKITVIR